MGIFSRIATFFGIRVNAALDKAKIPARSWTTLIVNNLNNYNNSAVR